MWGFAAPHPPRPAAPRPGEAAETPRGGARGLAPRAAAPEAPGARSAPPAARTPANFPRRPPPAPTPARGAAAPPQARVRTASPRRVAGGRLGGGPRAPLRLTRRVTRTATLGRGDASGPPRGSGAPVAPPALVHGALQPPGHRRCPALGPRSLRPRDASAPAHVHTAQGSETLRSAHLDADPATAAQCGVAPHALPVSPTPGETGRGNAYLARALTLLSRRCRLFHTFCNIVDGERKCYNPLPVTWLSPNRPLSSFFGLSDNTLP